MVGILFDCLEFPGITQNGLLACKFSNYAASNAKIKDTIEIGAICSYTEPHKNTSPH